MTSWILGVVAIAFWIFVIWLWRASSNRNFQQGDFEYQNPDIGKELEKLHKAGDDVVLEAFYRRHIKRWNMVGWLHSSYADFLKARGRSDEALAMLKSYVRRARRLEDEYRRDAMWERMALVRLLREEGRPADAERAAEESLARPMAAAPTAVLYAEIARDRGDHAEAARRYLLALERFPDQDSAAEGAVAALLAQDKADEAEEMLRQQIRAFPRAHGLAIRYARLAQERGDLEEAAERWAFVREQFVFRQEAYTEGADVLRRLGREAEAEAVLASRPRDISELSV